MTDRKFDVIVYGVTGFTGKLIAEYMNSKIREYDPPLRVGFAGRNKSKVEAVHKSINADSSIAIIEASTENPNSIAEMTSSTHVLLQVAGPYSLYGTPFLKSCVETATHYCDITGETFWVKEMSDRYDNDAKLKTLKIVNMCGFDSIPSDIGALYWSEEFEKRYGEKAESVENFFELDGGFSGGSINSLFEFKKLPSDVKKKSLDPYYLCGNDISKEQRIDKAAFPGLPNYEKSINKYSGFFLMESVNSRVVRKTKYLLEKENEKSPYSKTFSYTEKMVYPSWFWAFLMNCIFILFLLLINIPIVSGFIRKLLPQSGQGPDKEKRKNSFFKVTTVVSAKDKKLIGSISGGDPGYDETAKMLSECAISLSRDQTKENFPKRYGLLTPGLAFGSSILTDRLKKEGFKVTLQN